jgi:hypothetical protein
MRDTSDLSGRKFEHLEVIEFSHRKIPTNGRGSILYWKVRCGCGREFTTTTASLKRPGATCGCKNGINHVGEKYHRLIVICKTNEIKHHEHLFEFLCECGNKIVLPYNTVASGRRKSCGCLGIEKLRRGKDPGEGGLNRLLWQYTTSAKKAKRNFDLSIEEFKVLTKGNCYYCGAKPSQIVSMNPLNPKDHYSDYVYNGIDRIDNDKGYSKNNVVSCCKRCNKIKIDYTQKDFIDHCFRIVRHLGG